MQLRVQTVVVLFGLMLGISASGQTPLVFTGHWREQVSSGTPRYLDIEQNDQTLLVKTTVTSSKGSRQLKVTYHIGASETVYKGLDGDEFHTSVHWDGSALVFETVEHEGGRKLPEITVWTLSEDRNSLHVKRQSTKSSGKGESLTVYTRQP